MKKFPTPTDIAEMKARGYDSATIAEAEEKSKRGAAAEQLCRDIEAAFAGVTLGAGVGLREGQGLDDHADADALAALRALDEKDDWRRIPVNSLNECSSSLSFFDAEGMRFHLPAYVIAELCGEYHCDVVTSLTMMSAKQFSQFQSKFPSPSHNFNMMIEHLVGKFALLSPAQRRVIRAFLLFVAEDPDEWVHHDDIRRALDEYWTEPGDP